MTTTPLGRPLAVWTAVGHCDAKRGHEIAIVTDGARAYATGPLTDCDDVSRERTVLTVQCRQPDSELEPCPGEVAFDTTGEWGGRWTADPVEVEHLVRFGTPIGLA